MTQTATSNSPLGDGPIRVGGSSFSRPAALIGGAAALVALTAIATTLAIKPGSSTSGAEGRSAAMVAAAQLPSDAKMQKAAGQVADEGAPAKPVPAAAERKPAAPAATAKSPAPQKVASVCAGCGTIESVTPLTKKGEGTGVGAVGGAVVGGLLGSQIGGGKGKDAMTAIGVVGGGMAGHEIEKRQRATTVYQVKVRMDDGTTRTVTQSSAPAVGAKVTLEGSQLKARASS